MRCPVANLGRIAPSRNSSQIDTVDKDIRGSCKRTLTQFEWIYQLASAGFGMHEPRLEPAVQLVEESEKASSRACDHKKEREIEACASMNQYPKAPLHRKSLS